MKPEPWGEALDAPRSTTGRSSPGLEPSRTLVVPTPSGMPFTQALAAELATREHLVLACGRYEGIDQRVLDDAATRMEVREVSLGDYVLNGGEAAALVVIEAVVRLLPGFLGNAESLAGGVPRRTACWSTPSTPSRPLAGSRRSRGAALR